ncbi:helix-turn-helix domain-containing protein [Paenibacillus sp. FSL R10-2736]|uniref:helix-turn-helix domain-containing protein n=1 Tax=Paenibacillus sp. FSL R10-2736 TaxID=2954692 RepID=UPI0030FB0016
MLISKRIKKLRIQNGLTQSQLGDAIGVTKVSISGYESKKRIPDVNTLIRLADYFEVSVDFLIGREGGAYIKDLLKEDRSPYIFFGQNNLEEITTEEAQRLKEELEMYRLYQTKQKK